MLNLQRTTLQTASFLDSIVMLASMFILPSAVEAFGNADSTTTIFVDRVSKCHSSPESVSFVDKCAHPYALGVANAIRLFSTPPTKTTEDAIALACVSGCVHAVSSQLSGSMRDDTQCAQSVRADVGPLLLPMGLTLCAEGSGFDAVEFVDGSNLCFIQLTQIFSTHQLLSDLVDVDGHFQWPSSPYRTITLCQSLQRTGCCAATYHRVLTAFFMASCNVPEALQFGRLLELCAQHDVPLSTELCKMTGVNDTVTWLTEYNPYAEGVLAARQVRCAELSVPAVDAAVGADRGSGCWTNTCALMYSLDELARNLGMQSAEAFTYLVMLAGSFGGAAHTAIGDLKDNDMDRLHRMLWWDLWIFGTQIPLDRCGEEQMSCS